MLRFRRFIAVCRPVLVALVLPVSLEAATQIPATVSLGDLVQTYSGTGKTPSVVTQPAGLPVQMVYRDLSPSAPAPVSQVVYNDSPDPLFFSYLSYGFQAQQLSALGNLVQLGGTARKLESCDVILVSWARPENWPTWYAQNPAGYTHPITLTIYEVNSTNQLIFRTEVTQNILVPWRPATLPNGNVYPYNGYAFRANIPFPNGITLPERVMVMVSFDTESFGFAPIGSPGPYNVLNVAQRSNQNLVLVGTDVDPDVVLQVKNGTWYYPSTGWSTSSAPMIRLNALSSETITAPVNAGSWQASARVSNPDYLGTASATFTIQRAAASVEHGNLIQTVDGNQKPVTITTNPPDLATSTTYDGSSSPPVLPGSYAVQTQITDPNYLAEPASGELTLLGYTLDSWLEPWITNGQIPSTSTGDQDDPDQDSIPNLVEYALGLNPSTGSHGLSTQGTPQVEYSTNRLSLVYRKNLGATDLVFQVESASQLGGPEAWSPATTTNTVLATEGLIQTIQATTELPANDPRHFLRLKVARQESP